MLALFFATTATMFSDLMGVLYSGSIIPGVDAGTGSLAEAVSNS
ncbi:UNVERIFIED_ORG: hypothetical protein FNL38_101275 [Nocardia globerula]|uniref:Uncharacterized protein n=1 Tax=Nocardia globerula TaxID=1818 RepID=A0A652YWI0_NOCGL|nr:hypothetical protein SZ00_00165 [Rhodococcus sp. AD45]PVX64214.1 hypothetical protein C8E04_1487 [Rhodococcus globerulus]